jgi:HEAT repeat protein
MLVNKLGSTTPVTEQSVAENQLVKLGQSAVPLLNAHLRDDRRTYARIRIAFILGRLKDESSLPALVEAAGSEYVALQRAAVRSIVAIGGPRAKQSLMTLRKAARSPELSKEIDDALAKWQA